MRESEAVKPPKDCEHSSVLIIGAGAAGLGAAVALAEHGLKVAVIEGRGRLGGRIDTQHDPSLGLPVELGAEFIHGKSPELFSLARKAKLTLCDVTERHWYFEDGRLTKSEAFRKKIDSLMGKMKPAREDRSFKEFLDSLPNNKDLDRAKAIAVEFVEGFHAASIDRISINSLLQINEAAEDIAGDRSFRVSAGYQQVPNHLSEAAVAQGVTIHLNTVVKEIAWSTNFVRANCETGVNGKRAFTANAAVITVPIGVLQASPTAAGALRFMPPLPEKKLVAIRSLAMGQVIRVILLFREPFWETLKSRGGDKALDFFELGFIHYPGVPFPTWWSQLPLRTPMLVGWIGGPAAEQSGRLPEAAIFDRAVTSLEQILTVPARTIKEQLVSCHTHDWLADPFSRGAYSYVPVHGVPAQQELREPLDQTLFFAGEATSTGHVGTVHGALTSGTRAAQEILQTFK